MICTVDYCEREASKTGLCRNHYARKMRNPDSNWFLPSPHEKTVEQRFFEKVNKNGGYVDFTDPLVLVTAEDGECWLWTAAILQDGPGQSNGGYGRFGLNGKTTTAHRVVWMLTFGVIPEVIDHRCRRRHCVNPQHLEDTTARVNSIRGASPAGENHRKETCHKGHEMVDDGDRRRCPECMREMNLRITAEKTHCTNGHEYTPENLRYGPKGRRICLDCRANRYGWSVGHTVPAHAA